MRQSDQGAPGWFRALFVAVMAAVCALLAFFAVEQHSLRFQIDDLTLKLDTSRQREAKQTYEYNQVFEDLPLAQAELERVSPLAQELKEEESLLRQQRKDVRALLKTLEEELAARQAEYDALLLQAQALQEALSPLQDVLTIPAQSAD